METGLVAKVVENKGFYVFVPFPDTYLLAKQGITEVYVDIPDPRKHSPEQHRKVFGLIGEIARWSGGYISVGTLKAEAEYIRAEMTYRFCTRTGRELFSMSDADMSTVTEFIDYLVDFCIEFDVPCYDNSLLGYCEDVSRYIYACLAARKCAVCGKKAHIHHVDAIGMGYNRNEKPQLGVRCVPLHWKYHRECHDMGNEAFFAKYHICGIKLDDYLCKKLNFKA